MLLVLKCLNFNQRLEKYFIKERGARASKGRKGFRGETWLQGFVRGEANVARVREGRSLLQEFLSRDIGCKGLRGEQACCDVATAAAANNADDLSKELSKHSGVDLSEQR